MIKAVQPPWELDLVLPEIEALGMDLDLPPLQKLLPAVPQPVLVMQPEEHSEHRELEIVRHHRRETEIKPELGGLIW